MSTQLDMLGIIREGARANDQTYSKRAPSIMRSSGSAGLNRHVVRNERVPQGRRQRLHLGPQSCRRHREMSVEA